MTAYTDNKAIRKYLGHNGCECKVSIRHDGTIVRFGSPDPFDRSQDHWVLCGTRDEIVREMRQNGEPLKPGTRVRMQYGWPLLEQYLDGVVQGYRPSGEALVQWDGEDFNRIVSPDKLTLAPPRDDE